jgi:hypothetical protein
MLPVEVTVGSLRLTTSGSVCFERAQGLHIRIGNITAAFNIAPFSDAAFAVTRRADAEKLTLYLEATGKMPISPLSHFASLPQQIGTSGGTKIFLWWQLSRLHPDHEGVHLDYAVYEEVPAAEG